MNKLRKAVIIVAILSMAKMGFAQDSSIFSVFDSSAILLVAFLLAVVIFFIIALIWVSAVKGKEQDKSKETLNQILTGAVPIDREEEVMTDHEYDGIRELDNHLPPWWVWMFYGTMIFAVAYMVYYFSGLGPDQEQEYLTEMAIAAEEKEAIDLKMAELFDENNVELVTDEALLAEGKEIYTLNCAVCHREDGGGLIGPNFADDYWIHGGSMNDMYATIKDGVIEKGMISWSDQLTPFQMQNVASYIKSFQGTNPPDPKAAEGELYTGE